MSLRILIVPSGFKESLSSDEVATCIERGILAALPSAKTVKVPLADGGEGFTRVLVDATRGTVEHVEVTGPTGAPVVADLGWLGDGSDSHAVLEMASAAGLRLVPGRSRSPLHTTTYGVGELIQAALDRAAHRITIGCGDSGTSDGGTGMAQALGVRFLDVSGRELARGASDLLRLEHIDLSNLDLRFKDVQVDVACNWRNMLCGPDGVARVFGPQKGATSDDVSYLEDALAHYAEVIERDLGISVCAMAGAGASGGLGAALNAFLGATLHPWAEIVMEYVRIEKLMQEADLVFTAEGAIDYQTPTGKIPVEVARYAKKRDIPVVVLAGTIGRDANLTLQYGIDSYESILEAPCSLSEAMESAPELISRAAERIMRTVLIGRQLGQ